MQNEEWVVVSDLSIEKNVKDAFKNIVSAKDKFLFLFSAVGGFIGGKEIDDTSIDDLEKMLTMNLKTNFNILKEFKKRTFFVKPSIKKRMEKIKAARRAHRPENIMM